MRQRSVHTDRRKKTGAPEKQPGNQATVLHAAREIPAACVESPKGNKEAVRGNVPIPAENPAGALPEIGNNNNISLVINGAGFQPCLPLAHFVGGTQV